MFHVFTEAGDHDVTILRDGRVAGRFTVAVQPEGAVPQANVDLAGLAADADRSGNVTGHYAVREGGVMGFAVGLGVGRYAVVIGHTAGGGSRTVLDSRGQLPAGDLFAVTLITPGTYRATNLTSQARLPITVAMPGRASPTARRGRPWSGPATTASTRPRRTSWPASRSCSSPRPPPASSSSRRRPVSRTPRCARGRSGSP